MKLTTGILAAGLMTGGLWAQNPNVINNVQSTMNTVQQTKTNDSNAALGITAPIPAASAAKPEGLRSGQVREFRIAKLDAAAKKIEVELG